MSKVKMILDCDTGIDDALALAYILANPEIELLGVTTTFGNLSVDQSTTNTLALMELFHREDVPIYRGADHAWGTDTYIRDDILAKVHGANGIGNVDLPLPRRTCEEKTAVDFIIESAKRYKEDLRIVFLGPLTNFADCIQKEEEAMRTVGSITIMGGALTVQGNRTLYAESNILEDPIAAKFVFGSRIPIQVIPLDATLRTLFRVKDVEKWQTFHEVGRKFYEIACHYYLSEYQDAEIGGAMHDPLAAMAGFDPTIVTNWYPCNLTAEENGRTICAFEELNRPEKRHQVALDVDTLRFTDTYIQLVEELLKSYSK